MHRHRFGSYLTISMLTLLLWQTTSVASSAATIPESSDVVLIYDNADTEQQGRYNFMFTVDGDMTIYPCEANYCSVVQFQDRGQVTMTVYKLPEGFPRASTVQDPAKLEEYKQLAESTYTLEDIQTNWLPDKDGRPYQTVQLSPDGKVTIESNTYNKPDINTKMSTSKSGFWSARNIIAIVVGVLAIATIIFAGWYLRNYIRRRNRNL